MVRAILAGSKSQTRRVVTAANSLVDGCGMSANRWAAMQFDFAFAYRDDGPSPAGNLGPYLHVPARAHDTVHRIYPRWRNEWERAWVKETWRQAYAPGHGGTGAIYRADKPSALGMDRHQWRPSIFMPRSASRITLAITGVRVERLQEISVEDAKAEGIGILLHPDHHGKPRSSIYGPYQTYRDLWESNGPGSWDENPWVWVIEFKRLTDG